MSYRCTGSRSVHIGSQPAVPPVSAGSGASVEEHRFIDEEPDGEVLNEEEFNTEEAFAQEIHDLSYSTISFLRRVDTEGSKHLFSKRSQRRFREPVSERYRRLLHGHFDPTGKRCNNFRTSAEFREGQLIYREMCEKILTLLDKDLMDRLVKSAGKCCLDRRSDGIHSFRHHMAKASWRTFPFVWYRHAPFELQKLRADISSEAVENARFYRDNSTIRYLFALTEAEHPFREQIEQRLFKISQEYEKSRK